MQFPLSPERHSRAEVKYDQGKQGGKEETFHL